MDHQAPGELKPFPEDGPRKPRAGAACNGCGMCCVATPCKMALDLVPGAEMGEPCPALEWEHGRSWCGMVRNPTKHSPEVAEIAAAVKPELRGAFEAYLGGRVRTTLGDGECDSGGGTGDPAVGMTALAYHEQRPELNPAERQIVGAIMRLMYR